MMAVTNIDSISLKTLAVPTEGLRLSLYLDITGFSSVSVFLWSVVDRDAVAWGLALM